MEKIKLSRVLEIIYGKNQHGKPNVFDVEVRTLNRYKKTGGTLKVYRRAKLSVSENSSLAVNVKEVIQSKPKSFKFPNHKKNRTINIDVQGVSHPVRIHKKLIEKFNGLEVVY